MHPKKDLIHIQTMAGTSASTYMGTLIFCIIATVVTIAIIAMFFLINVEPVKYMLLTIEICLVLIVVHSIITIVMYEKASKKYKQGAVNAPIPDLSCPDYFTRNFKDGTPVCENVYDTKKTYITVGPHLTEIDISALNKKVASDACKVYDAEYNGKIPWTDIQTKCETVA